MGAAESVVRDVDSFSQVRKAYEYKKEEYNTNKLSSDEFQLFLAQAANKDSAFALLQEQCSETNTALGLLSDNDLNEVLERKAKASNLDEDGQKRFLEELHSIRHDDFPHHVRLIKLENFKKCGRCPRFPNDKELVTKLSEVDRDNAMIVFISHCWLRGYGGAEDFNVEPKGPHPDTIKGDKFELCVEGIRKAKATYAPKMDECYLWLDYGAYLLLFFWAISNLIDTY